MVRYDKVEETSKVQKSKQSKQSLEKVQITKEVMQKIVDIYINRLNNLLVRDVPVITKIHRDQIIFNQAITLDQLSTHLGKTLESKTEFAKEFYMYSLDSMINEAYGKDVIAIQEFPYSFQETQNSNVVTFEFIV